jgi:hypothetical protein
MWPDESNFPREECNYGVRQSRNSVKNPVLEACIANVLDPSGGCWMPVG